MPPQQAYRKERPMKGTTDTPTKQAAPRSHRHKTPIINSEDAQFLQLFRGTSAQEKEALLGKFHREKEPVGPQGLEELQRDFLASLAQREPRRRTVELYAGAIDRFGRFLAHQMMYQQYHCHHSHLGYTHITQAEARKALLEHHPRAKG
jgi:hypothetical protein